MEMDICTCRRPDPWEDDLGRSFCFKCAGLLARKRFRHMPLRLASDIRLIKLLPGADEDAIHCEIFRANLDTFPEYEAVSYTWGDSILCANVSCGRARFLPVTSNCEAALRDLRYLDSERILWIDAVCIDQGENDEKTHQVRLMRRIYAQAEHVSVYLGRISNIDREAEELEPALQWLTSQGASVAVPGIQPGVTALLSMPWFSRVWVLQEIAAAKHATVIFGPHRINWDRLALSSLEMIGIAAVDKKGSTPAVLSIAYQNSHPIPDLVSLLTTARSCLSLNPRDKVYALQGLLKDPSVLNLSPKYDIAVENLYTKVTKQIIRTHNRLDILSEVGKEWKHVQEPTDPYEQVIRLRTEAEEALKEACDATEKLRLEIDKLDVSTRIYKYEKAFEDFRSPPCNLKSAFQTRHNLLHPRTFRFLLENSGLNLAIFLETFFKRPRSASRLKLRKWGMRSPLDMAELFNFGRDQHQFHSAIEIFPRSIRGRILSSPDYPVCKRGPKSKGNIAKELFCPTGIAAERGSISPEFAALMEFIPQVEQKTQEAERLDRKANEMLAKSDGFTVAPDWVLPDEDVEPQDYTDRLPSWVPDIGKQTRLSSLDTWRSDSLYGAPVAKFQTDKISRKRHILKVRALRVDFLSRSRPKSVEVATTGGLGNPFETIRIQHQDEFMWDLEEKFSPNAAPENRLKYWKSFKQFCTGRKLGVTTTETFAICPMRAQSTDSIFLIDGARVPFVLRAKDPSADHKSFKLIGECYVQGINRSGFAGTDYTSILGSYLQQFGDIRDDELPWEYIKIV